MDKCKYCGNTLMEGDDFCTNCGHPVKKKRNTRKWNQVVWVQGLVIICLLFLIAFSFILYRPMRQDNNSEMTGEKDIVKEKIPDSEQDDFSEVLVPGQEDQKPDSETSAVSEGEGDDGYSAPIEPEVNEPDPSLETVNNSPAEDGSGRVPVVSTIEWHDQNLRKAVLHQINIGDEIDVVDAENVQSLTLDEQGIRDIQDLHWFTNLRELSLKGNYISDISSLAGMTNLEKLNLEINSVEDIAPLSGLTNLRRLDLYSNRIVDISPLSDMTGLRMLDIRQNYVEDISVLYRMTEMEELYMSSNRITDIWPVNDMNRLRYLSFKENPVEDISYLHGKNNLDTLVIASTNVEEIGVVQELPALAYLDVRGCDIADRTVISRLKKRGGIKIEE